MKKVEIQVEKTFKYEYEIVVIQPDGMTEDEFNTLLSKAERDTREFEGGAKEFAYALCRLGFKVEKQSFSFPDSPSDSEFEILNIRDIK